MIKSGSKLNTISAAKSVYAFAEVQEVFDTEFGIYDLSEFLGALSLFNDPDISFGEKFAVIKEGQNSIKYFSADSSVLTVPTKELKLPPSDVEFALTADQMNMIQRTAGVLRAGDVSFVGNGSTITVTVGDVTNSTSNAYNMAIGETDSVFNAHLKIDNMKMIPGPYKVELSNKKIAKFGTTKLSYVCSLEADSQFGE